LPVGQTTGIAITQEVEFSFSFRSAKATCCTDEGEIQHGKVDYSTSRSTLRHKRGDTIHREVKNCTDTDFSITVVNTARMRMMSGSEKIDVFDYHAI